MNNPENDNDLAPHEEIEREYDAGRIPYEDAVIKLLALLTEAAWVLVIDVDKLVNMKMAQGETKH